MSLAELTDYSEFSVTAIFLVGRPQGERWELARRPASLSLKIFRALVELGPEHIAGFQAICIAQGRL